MLLTEKDREFVQKISATSRHPESVVRDVLKSMLYCATLEVYKSFDHEDYVPTITIPFIAELKLHYRDVVSPRGLVTKVDIEAHPMRALVEEIRHASDGTTTPTEKVIENQIYDKFYKKLDNL